MIAIEEVLTRIVGVEQHELVSWIDNRWVLPTRAEQGWLFSDVDIARVELIVEIRREFAIDDEALSLVLGLMDQVYGLRRQLRRVCDALACQPEEVRRAIQRALPRDRD